LIDSKKVTVSCEWYILNLKQGMKCTRISQSFEFHNTQNQSIRSRVFIWYKQTTIAYLLFKLLYIQY